MFTGIIEKVAPLQFIEKKEGELQLAVETGFTDLQLGESIALDGVCLTVEKILNPKLGVALFYVSPETLTKTRLGDLLPGERHSQLNIERAMQLGSRLSGHWVQGHVDGTGHLFEKQENGDSTQYTFQLPASLIKYCVEKGSIAINGISLTINTVDSHRHLISVCVIPHTESNTNLSFLNPMDRVNVENDILAKYVEKLCQTSQKH